MGEWKIRINDKYPAYVDWATFETIQAMFRDNCSEYDRNKTRGVPRPGKALLHGIVYCGECGHQMVVQYKPKTHYICNYLRQQYHVPVCQYLPADPIDDFVVGAFFGAISPAELDLYDEAAAAIRREAEVIRRSARADRSAPVSGTSSRAAIHPGRSRESARCRRTGAALGNRLAGTPTGGGFPPTRPPQRKPSADNPAELRCAFEKVGQDLQGLWGQGQLAQAQKKALLRCLIDKVVIRRIAPDSVEARIVWKGGDTTTAEIPVTVNSLARLSSAGAMEETIVRMARQGKTDREIAEHLTRQGHRSPKGPVVLVSTVRIIRLRHRLLVNRSQSQPRRIPGHLTVSQVAERLQVSKHWIYDRIHNGTIEIEQDPETKLFLFKNDHVTIKLLEQLKAGKAQKVRL